MACYIYGGKFETEMKSIVAMFNLRLLPCNLNQRWNCSEHGSSDVVPMAADHVIEKEVNFSWWKWFFYVANWNVNST